MEEKFNCFTCPFRFKKETDECNLNNNCIMKIINTKKINSLRYRESGSGEWKQLEKGDPMKSIQIEIL